jgi:hypothetical protein
MPPPMRTMQQPIYCLDCSYLLNGIAGASCPECGRSFSLRDPSSYTTYQRSSHKKVFDALTPSVLRAIGVVNGIICALAMATVAGAGYAPRWVIPLFRILAIPDETLSYYSRRSEWLAAVLLFAAIDAGAWLACMMIAARRRKRHALIPRVALTLGVIGGLVCALAVMVVMIAVANLGRVPPAPMSVWVTGVLGALLCTACMLGATRRDRRRAVISGLLQALGVISGIVCILAVTTLILSSYRSIVDRRVVDAMSLLAAIDVGLCVACMILAALCSERYALIPGLVQALGTIAAIMCALAVATVLLAPHSPRFYSWVIQVAPLFGVASAGLGGACMARARS